MSNNQQEMPSFGKDGISSCSRRQFLRGGTAVLITTTLAACGLDPAPPQAPWQTATPAEVLQSPIAITPPAPEATPTLPPDTLGLDRFLALSAVLTGVNELNPTLGRVYWQSLASSSKFAATLEALYEEAGTPPTLATLEAKGIFAREATRKLADKIIEYWYTGTYTDSEGETAVATYVDALAWKVLDFTKPATICGEPDFWAERP